MRVLLLLPALLAVHTAAAQGVVRGAVVDAETGETVPGANVILEGTDFGVATGLDGQFEIGGVPAGAYTLVASFLGYRRYTAPVTVRDGETTTPAAPRRLERVEPAPTSPKTADEDRPLWIIRRQDSKSDDAKAEEPVEGPASMRLKSSKKKD